MTTVKLYTMNDIQTHNRRAGRHWFEPGTMRFHGTRVHDEVYQGPGGVFFTTSDKAGFRAEDGREYNVRTYNPETGDVGTAKDCGPFKTKYRATKAAKALAGEGAVKVAEAFKPTTILEQFVHDLQTHGNGTATEAQARRLVVLAARHHAYAERDCNGFGTERMREINDRSTARTEAEVLLIAKTIGAKGCRFQGDPRGVTVKLVWEDGRTNDFGSDGWVVPTSLKDE